MASFTSASGIPMTRLDMVQAYFNLHRDHVAFVIGSRGATVKGVAASTGADIRINKSGDAFRIRGPQQSVEAAYFKLREIANTANDRMPRVGLPQQGTQHPHQQQFVVGQSQPTQLTIASVARITTHGNPTHHNQSTPLEEGEIDTTDDGGEFITPKNTAKSVKFWN